MKRLSMMRRGRGYLAQRRALGFRLRSEGDLLLNFARYADRHGCGTLTNPLAIAWARLPKGTNRHRWARRLEAVRRLAQFLAVTDPATEFPPRHLFGPAKQPYQPFLYRAKQVAQLLAAARRLSGQQRPRTYQTLIGLLACTGLRISEALQLKVAEVDLQRGAAAGARGQVWSDPVGSPPPNRTPAIAPLCPAPSKTLSAGRAFLCLRIRCGPALQHCERGFCTLAPDDCRRGTSTTHSRSSAHTCLPRAAARASQPPRGRGPSPHPLAIFGSPSRPRHLLVPPRFA